MPARRAAALTALTALAACLTAVLPAGPAGADGATAAAGTRAGRHLWHNRTATFIGRARTPAAPRSVSGLGMPTAAPAGWRVLKSDDFTRTSLGSGWTPYSRNPSAEWPGAWDPANVVLRDGKLVLVGRRVNGVWRTAGASFPAATTTYGRYELRMRMDPSAAVKHAALLWPVSGRWPLDGEIDFSEDGGGARKHIDAHLHWGADNLQLHATTPVDLTIWHTVGVEWLPGRVTYTLDGRPWATMTTSGVPSTAMDLAVQTEAVPCSGSADCTSTAEVDLELDWVVVYARA